MVEMAIVLPIFLTLVLGIMEFSYALAQHNEIRHVVRDAARAVAVDAAADPETLICDAFNLVDGSGASYDITGVSIAPQGPGGTAEMMVTVPYQTLTGFFDGAFSGTTLDSTHNFYVEQATIDGSPSWPTGGTVNCP